MAPGYLPSVYSTIKKAGGLCIADEVQAGFARTGSHFWGFEAHGVVPDIVTMAKVNFLIYLIIEMSWLPPFARYVSKQLYYRDGSIFTILIAYSKLWL